MGVAGDEVRLLGHAYLLYVLHALGVFLAHEGHALIGAFYIVEGLHQQVFLGQCCKLYLFFLALSLLLLPLPLLLLHALLVLVAAVVDLLVHLLPLSF